MLVYTPWWGSLACSVFNLGPEGSKEEAGAASVPSAEEHPGEGK